MFILIIVVLIALGLNTNLFTTEKNETKIELPTPIKESATISQENETTKAVLIPEKIQIHDDSNLTAKLNKLMKEASKLFQKNEDNEAQKIYDLIIELTQNSKNPKILKYFADAHNGKAFLYNVYPNNDSDSAIEEYEMILEKFENAYDVKLLKMYLSAKLQQAQLLSKDEIIETYDELIKKFSADKENRFQKEVEELQFSKSFALMGVNDEEAMEVLDNIIAKYQEKGSGKLPQTVQYSILNNIELSIITNNDDEKYVDLANKYLSDSADTQPLLEMLNIVKNAQDLDQTDALTQWKEEHNNYHFPDWDFSELKKWADDMEDAESQARIREYLDTFEKQKYNRNYSNEIYNDQGQNNNNQKDQGQNTNEDTSSSELYEDNDTPLNYEPIEYEADPYINDVYQNADPYQPSYPSPEVSYDNPYLNSQANGVSHNYFDPLE